MTSAIQMSSPTVALIRQASDVVAKILDSQYQDGVATRESNIHRAGLLINAALRLARVRLITVRGYDQLVAAGGDQFGRASASKTLSDAIIRWKDCDTLRVGLADDQSQGIFDWFLKMRVAYAEVGEEALVLFPPPVLVEDYRQQLVRLSQQRQGNVYDVGGLRIESCPETILDSVVYQQYLLPDLVEPSSGDTVLDIGAFKGETTLWFAQKIGPSGLVVAFEPILSAVRVCVENVRRNQGRALGNIQVENLAVGAQTGSCTMTQRGNSGDAVTNSSTSSVKMTSIDEYVRISRVSRVDFIKMDIEGMERGALEGGMATIRRFRPKLAIACYHKGDDLRVLASMIHRQEPSYKLHLAHKSPTWHDTVLFACSDRGGDVAGE